MMPDHAVRFDRGVVRKGRALSSSAGWWLEAADYVPTIVKYLETGWTKPQLQELFDNMQARPRDILREKGAPAAELALLESSH